MSKVVFIFGGMANQMFQYAFSRTLGDNVFLNPYSGERGFLLHHFNTKYTLAPRTWIEALEQSKAYGISHEVRERIINVYQPDLLNRDGAFIGQFQSEKYFAHLRPQLLQEFTLSHPLDDKNRAMLDKISSCENPIAIHVRRGDYLRLAHIHLPCTPEYYRAAIDIIMQRVQNPHFFLFSDDLPWAIENVRPCAPCTPVDINTGATGYFDIELMKHCRHFIIANSSFSWWGAWLSEHPDKIVVAPRRWHIANQNMEWDIFPDGWIVI